LLDKIGSEFDHCINNWIEPQRQEITEDLLGISCDTGALLPIVQLNESDSDSEKSSLSKYNLNNSDDNNSDESFNEDANDYQQGTVVNTIPFKLHVHFDMFRSK
jgi:hypothetical protein